MAVQRGLDVEGRYLDLVGHRIYVERSGDGPIPVVLEAGLGFGRTSWDRLVPLLAASATVVAYDRVGHGRSDPGHGPTSIEELATILHGVVDAAADDRLVLVAHSMGGLIARQVAPALGSRLAGLVLLDPTPETASMFDDVRRLTRGQAGLYRAFEAASHLRPLRGAIGGVGTRSFRDALPRATYETILEEDLTPSGFAQMRREAWVRADAVVRFRRRPPRVPGCPVILLSAGRAVGGSGAYLADVQEHQRRYVDGLPDGRFEVIDAGHLVQAEQPGIVADRIRGLIA
jgi:pimeloyl-ACP methyl ester carboxylesterase